MDTVSKIRRIITISECEIKTKFEEIMNCVKYIKINNITSFNINRV